MAIELASSIAGLLGLAGLVVQSASTLYTFCRNVPHVAAEVKAVIEEIKKLEDVLQTIKLITHDCNTSSIGQDLVQKLETEIASCSAELSAWSSAMELLGMRQGESARNVVKKLKLAADKGRFVEIRQKISAGRDQLGILVELLGVHIGKTNSGVINEVKTKFDTFTLEQELSQKTRLKHLENIKETVHAVRDQQVKIQNDASEISRAMGTIHETLAQIQDTNREVSIQQATKLNTLLAALQNTLLVPSAREKPRAISHKKPAAVNRRMRRTAVRAQATTIQLPDRTSTPKSKNDESPKIPQEQIVQITEAAILTRCRRGRTTVATVTLPDKDFEDAPWEMKIQMVKYLQGLRLLLWLVTRSTNAEHQAYKLCSLPTSVLTLEAEFAYSWLETHVEVQAIDFCRQQEHGVWRLCLPTNANAFPRISNWLLLPVLWLGLYPCGIESLSNLIHQIQSHIAQAQRSLFKNEPMDCDPDPSLAMFLEQSSRRLKVTVKRNFSKKNKSFVELSIERIEQFPFSPKTSAHKFAIDSYSLTTGAASTSHMGIKKNPKVRFKNRIILRY